MIEWKGHDDEGKIVDPGVYIYRFKAGTFIKSKKMIIVRSEENK